MAGSILPYVRRTLATYALKSFPPEEYQKTVFIAGSARSGTTWISNIINHKKDFRLIFEPVHPEYVAEFKEFNDRQYLAPGEEQEIYRRPLELLIKGKIFSKWSDSRLNTFFPKKLLIKDIRANLLLFWIHEHFPNTRFIFLMRHPYHVVKSRIKLGWGGNTSMFTSQPELVRDHLMPYMDIIRGASSPIKELALVWCIENLVPLKQFPKDKLQICFYEDFIYRPEEEFIKLMKFLDEPVSPVPGNEFRLSSDTNWNQTNHEQRKNSDLYEKLSEEEKMEFHKLNSILEAFGLNAYYDEYGNPVHRE